MNYDDWKLRDPLDDRVYEEDEPVCDDSEIATFLPQPHPVAAQVCTAVVYYFTGAETEFYLRVKPEQRPRRSTNELSLVEAIYCME